MRRIIVIFGVIFVSSVALAGADIEIHVRFVGFSADHRYALVDVTDPNSGDRFEVYKVATGKKLLSKPYYTPTQQIALQKRLSKKYNIKDPGKSSFQDPSGKLFFSGVMGPRYFKVLVMKGKRKAVFDKIRMPKEGEVQLKEVWWSKDGRAVVLIVNKKLSTPGYGFDIDVVRPKLFFPSSLRFR